MPSLPERPSLAAPFVSTFAQASAGNPVEFSAPASDEYAPYYGRYVTRVPEGNFFSYLRQQASDVLEVFSALSEEQAGFAYAAGKWTVKEVLGHLSDTERVFAYRALSIGRGDPNPLPGMEQDEWMPAAEFNRRSLRDLVEEWLSVRAATITLAEGLPPGAALRRGVASEKPFSVRALLHVAPGHTNYHFEVLRERYFGAPDWPR